MLASSQTHIKIRTACDHCHASKVRCSGEKDGCSRCTSLSHECVYSLSRVGRNPGSRNKKRACVGSRNSNSPSLETREELNKVVYQSHTPQQLDFRDQDETSFDWAGLQTRDTSPGYDCLGGNMAGVLDSVDFGLMTPVTSDAVDNDIATSPPAPFFYSSLPSPGLDGLPMAHDPASPNSVQKLSEKITSVDTPREAVAPFRQESRIQLPQGVPRGRLLKTSSSLLAQRPKFPTGRVISSHGIIVCCAKTIEQLDRKLNGPSVALDEIMRTNKVSVGELSRILVSEECKQSWSCLMLVTVAMDRIVTLFETAIRSEETHTKGTSALTSPFLAFGSFQVDPEEQVTLRAHILEQEIRRSLQTLAKLSPLLHALSSQPSKNTSLQWCADLEHRLETLITIVEDTWH